MAQVSPLPPVGVGPDQVRPGQQLLPGYVVKLLKTIKIPFGTDRTMNGVDVDPTVALLGHIVDCMGALRDVNKVYRAKGSLASRSVGARAMFGFTAELGNLLLDAITFNPPSELKEAATFYSAVGSSILNVFPEIAAQVTRSTGKMLIHHTALKASPTMAMDAVKMVTKAFPAGAWSPDSAGALPLHWITHNASCNYELVSYLISANPKAPWVADVDGYLPLHWAVNQDFPNVDVVAALLTANPGAASKACNKGSLPLHWCVNREAPLMGVVQALLQAHPDAVRTFDDEGWLPIHRCVDRSNISIAVLKVLVELYPQGLQCRNSDGQLPLHRALDHQYPNEEAIEYMLETYQGSAQVQDDEGYLPLHMGLDCAAPSPLIVRLILDAYPEAAFQKSKDGLLPLHCAVSCVAPVIEIVESLLEIFPESPEHLALDIVPLDEFADPDTWQGEWKERRWTPLSRAVDRKLDPIIALFKAALNKSLVKRRTTDSMGSPVKVVSVITTKRLIPQTMPPINAAVLTDIEEENEAGGGLGGGPSVDSPPRGGPGQAGSLSDQIDGEESGGGAGAHGLPPLTLGQGPRARKGGGGGDFADTREEDEGIYGYGAGYGPDGHQGGDGSDGEGDDRRRKDKHRSRKSSSDRDRERGDRDRDRDRHRGRERDKDRDRHREGRRRHESHSRDPGSGRRHRKDSDERDRGNHSNRRRRRRGDVEEGEGPITPGSRASARSNQDDEDYFRGAGGAGGDGGAWPEATPNKSSNSKYFVAGQHKSPNEPPPKVYRDAAALQEQANRPKAKRTDVDGADDFESGGEGGGHPADEMV